MHADDMLALVTHRYDMEEDSQPQKVLSLAQIVSKNQEKREATAARFFQTPSTTQGFQYLYLPLVNFALLSRNWVLIMVVF
jgi:hypothetical protein